MIGLSHFFNHIMKDVECNEVRARFKEMNNEIIILRTRITDLELENQRLVKQLDEIVSNPFKSESISPCSD
jgi:cell shape-determining protein MreC|tara:strand:+ start:6093 stop:6305 length:213 start_codon:yes stop_codon:yes gene_type:complete